MPENGPKLSMNMGRVGCRTDVHRTVLDWFHSCQEGVPAYYNCSYFVFADLLRTDCARSHTFCKSTSNTKYGSATSAPAALGLVRDLQFSATHLSRFVRSTVVCFVGLMQGIDRGQTNKRMKICSNRDVEVQGL